MSARRHLAVSVRGLAKAYTIVQRVDRFSRPVTLTEAVLQRARRPFHRPHRETYWALKDISFDIHQGEVVGIIGRNGAGKSTLLKVLSRITEPTRGQVKLYGRLGALLEVGTGFHPELTGRENIFLNGQILGLRRREIERHFDAIVDFADVEAFIDTPVKRYSSGMYVRLAFAVAAHLSSDILVLDEVLAVGDAKFQEKCLGKMKDVAGAGRTVLFVSHNMASVADLCDTGILLEKGAIRQIGNLREVIAAYVGNHAENEIEFDHGALRSVAVQQIEHDLEITARYEARQPLPLPCLGFAVSDLLGAPIFGANPRFCDIDEADVARQSGTVRVRVRQPKLLDGTYRLTVWFGDGVGQDECYRDCLNFRVEGAAGSRQPPAAVTGPVFPECRWEFTD